MTCFLLNHTCEFKAILLGFKHVAQGDTIGKLVGGSKANLLARKQIGSRSRR
jgi:hypothetical protein